MNQSFYVGALGAQQQLRHLNVHGNNIANVNTYGFKAEKARFASLMTRDYRGIGGGTLPVAVGTNLFMTSTDFNPGPVASTQRMLDYMIDGDGFFAVVDLDRDNEVTYTRCGAFTVSELTRDSDETDEDGNPIQEKKMYLSDGEGRFVLGTDGGLIEVTDPSVKLPVGIFDYNNYNGMEHLRDTKFQPVEKNGDLYVGTGTLVQGALELSNADLGEEMTKVIEAQRAYGMALRMVQVSDEIETTINGLRG